MDTGTGGIEEDKSEYIRPSCISLLRLLHTDSKFSDADLWIRSLLPEVLILAQLEDKLHVAKCLGMVQGKEGGQWTHVLFQCTWISGITPSPCSLAAWRT